MAAAIDTVGIISPPIDLETRNTLWQYCTKYQGINMDTGEISYCITTGKLEGSYDYRISIKVDNMDCVRPDGVLVPVMVQTDWYIRVECSVHKLMNNHNVYGGPQDVKKSIAYLVKFIEDHTRTKLPDYTLWELDRVDIAKIYVFDNPKICERMIQQLKDNVYSRTKPLPYEFGVMWSGSTSTKKFYWKGPEFKKHDYKRLMKHYERWLDRGYKEFGRMVHKVVNNGREICDSILERAMRTIRFEVQIKPRKLKELFNTEKVLVGMLDDKVINEFLDYELRRIIKEREDMDIVRRSDLVEERLNSEYGTDMGNKLYGVWAKMVERGEKALKDKMTKATFYKYRKLLMDAGVSWSCGNVNLRQISIVPNDFSFVDNKYVDEKVSESVLAKLDQIA